MHWKVPENLPCIRYATYSIALTHTNIHTHALTHTHTHTHTYTHTHAMAPPHIPWPTVGVERRI